MRLATIQSVQEAIGVDAGLDSQNAIDDALDSASYSLAAALNTVFDRETRVDEFSVDFSQYPVGHVVRLGLSRGFLSGTPTVKVARLRADFGTAELDISAEVSFDMDKGYLSFDAEIDLSSLSSFSHRSRQLVLRPWWFRVQYTSGFAAGTGDTAKDYQSVPEWLAQAARLQARIALNAHPAFVANESVTDAKALESQLATILVPKRRYMPWAELPKMSSAVA